MDKNKLIEIVKTSKTQTEVLLKMGIRSAGGNFKTLKKYLKLYDIDTNHFNPGLVRIQKINQLSEKIKIPIEEILKNGSTYNRARLKERLFIEGYKERKCELCNQGEIWMGNKMSLILDHINGVWNDNRIENLRIVCPNCNATLPTHCGKNIPKLKKSEELTNNKKDFYIKRRKVDRPDLKTLLFEINILGYVKTGKKYGVSDNCIRKWVKYYEKYDGVA